MEENWQNFWDSIEEEFQRYTEQTKVEHFVGTIITRHISDTWRKIPKSIELVDGQQRITSVAILRKASLTEQLTKTSKITSIYPEQ